MENSLSQHDLDGVTDHPLEQFAQDLHGTLDSLMASYDRGSENLLRSTRDLVTTLRTLRRSLEDRVAPGQP